MGDSRGPQASKAPEVSGSRPRLECAKRLGPVTHPELAEQASLGVLGRLRGDAQRPRCLADRVALGERGRDVAFPGGQRGSSPLSVSRWPGPG
jgi:hypothetical protein